jgi:hypothetical protein
MMRNIGIVATLIVVATLIYACTPIGSRNDLPEEICAVPSSHTLCVDQHTTQRRPT